MIWVFSFLVGAGLIIGLLLFITSIEYMLKLNCREAVNVVGFIALATLLGRFITYVLEKFI